MDDADAKPGERAPRYDPAAPHTAPYAHHMPRWLAWLLLAAFAASAALCARIAVGS